MCLPATVVEVASPLDEDARAMELGLVAPGMTGPDVGALPDGEGTGAGPTGDDDGVVDTGAVDVRAGSVEDAGAELGLVVPGVAGPDDGAFPDGEETGAGPTGDDDGVVDDGVVDVWVGSSGDAVGVELTFVVLGVAGPDDGAFPDGEETGAGPTGVEVGAVDVWIGSTGDATGVGSPVGGAEVGCCEETGVGVGIGG